MINIYQKAYIDFLEKLLSEKKRKNSQFSMRSFASKLSTSPGTLSQVLSGKRPLTLAKAVTWCEYLSLDETQSEFFLDAVSKYENIRNSETESKLDKIKRKYQYEVLQNDKISILKNWYHLAILSLVTLEGFQNDNKWISNKLGITEDQAEDSVELLQRLGLILAQNGKIERTTKDLESSTDIPSSIIRSYHKQNIARALGSIERRDIHERDITSITMPIDSSKIAEAKKRIAAFRRELAGFLKGKSQADNDNIYSLNIQLFPQTSFQEK